VYSPVLLVSRSCICWWVPWTCLPPSPSRACLAGRLLAVLGSSTAVLQHASCSTAAQHWLLVCSDAYFLAHLRKHSEFSLNRYCGSSLTIPLFFVQPIPSNFHVKASFTCLAATMRVIAILVLILHQGFQHWCRGDVSVHLPKARTTTVGSHVQDPCQPQQWHVAECPVDVTREAT